MFRSRVLGQLLGLTLLLGGSQASRADDPPPTTVADPELMNLQRQVQRELAELRREIGQAGGSETNSPTAMGSPAMPAPPPGRAVLQSRPTRAAGMPRVAPQASDALPQVELPPPVGNESHWSFRPVVRPTLPAIGDAKWPRDELDRFVLARLEAKSVRPNADADRETLIRRVAFDLTGLPASAAEIRAFARDPAPLDEALARVVDRYLASPRFGERWARHWFDVVHYADSVGQIWNAPFTYAWRYRDWVIDAFNADKPYDRFVIEQLAGDLLPASSVEEQRSLATATGMLALGSLDLVDGQVETFVLDRVDDQIDVTTRALLGITVSCARCHDHKFDAITMRDYYALAGVFYSTLTLSGQGTPDRRGRGYVDHEMLAELPTSDHPASPRNWSATVPGPRAGLHSMADMQDEWSKGYRDLRYTTDPDLAMALTEGQPRDCELRVKGDAYDRAAAPPRGDVHIPGLPPIPPIAVGESGRLELACWVASPAHPLTARVMVNRVWQHLMGRGLVATVDDFGSTGEPPSHPDLLDHLAARFVADQWSIKRLVRVIVLSRTYRLSSAGRPANEQVDPANDLYWRANLRRLELEPLRDTMLLAAGRLTFERPEGIQIAGVGGKGRFGTTRSLLEIDAPYRTVYLPVLRSLLPQMYQAFDFPDPSQILGRREVTTVAPQALFLMNSDFAVECAQEAATRLLREPLADDAERVRAAYYALLGRHPQTSELKDALELVHGATPAATARDPDRYRWALLVQGLMASGEFRYLK